MLVLEASLLLALPLLLTLQKRDEEPPTHEDVQKLARNITNNREKSKPYPF